MKYIGEQITISLLYSSICYLTFTFTQLKNNFLENISMFLHKSKFCQLVSFSPYFPEPLPPVAPQETSNRNKMWPAIAHQHSFPYSLVKELIISLSQIYIFWHNQLLILRGPSDIFLTDSFKNAITGHKFQMRTLSFFYTVVLN